MEDRVYDFFAASIQDGYVGRLVEIVEKAGGAKSLYYMKDYEIEMRLGVSSRMAKHIVKCRDETDLEADYEKMLEQNIKFICYKDDKYPKKLRNISSKPYGIFVKGNLPKENAKSVAIIGARECTEYGRTMAEYFGSRLAGRGIDVISGMAWGIDGIAQMAALKAGGRSYAVLGCGVDIIYPRKNYEVYERLSCDGSGIISEYVPGTKAESRRFPPRNRIISALSDIVLVVEARDRSGTLITVDMAASQGKTVMIVPGRITDPLSVGCLRLMKDGAIPALGIDDILDELGVMETTDGDTICHRNSSRVYENSSENEDSNKSSEKCLTEDNINTNAGNINTDTKVMLTKEEDSIYKILNLDPMDINVLTTCLEMSVEELMINITNLEIKGLIRECAPGFFVKKY